MNSFKEYVYLLILGIIIRFFVPSKKYDDIFSFVIGMYIAFFILRTILSFSKEVMY